MHDQSLRSFLTDALSQHLYSIYSELLISNLHLPGLASLAPASEGARTIALHFGPGGSESKATSCRLWAPSGVECRAQFGSRPSLSIHSGLAIEEILNLLCGSWLPALLSTEGALILRGSAVSGPDGAILILGPSMAGKSVAAASLSACGWPIISDDVVVLRQTERGPSVSIGAPWLKLWPGQAVLGEAIGSVLGPVRNGLAKLRFAIRAAPSTASTTFPVARVLILQSAEISSMASKPLAATALLEILGVLQRPPPIAPRPPALMAQFAMLCALARLPQPLLVQRPSDPVPAAEMLEQWSGVMAGCRS